MKKITLLFLILCFSITQAQTVVNFTTAEGYVNGSLRNHANWDGTVTYPTWLVDAATGTVTTEKIWQRAVWGQAFVLTGNAITFRSDFNFTGTLDEVNTVLILFGFSTTATFNTGSHNFVYLSAREDEAILQLRNNTNTGNLSPSASLLIADCQGDDLAVELTLTLGADAANSTISAKLINVSDSTESDLGSYTGVNATLFSSATTTGVYGMFHSQDFLENQSITAINMNTVTMTENPTLGISKHEDILDFSVSPNPINDFVQFSGVEMGSQIYVYSIEGKKVGEYIYNGNPIDLSSLNSGMYIMNISGRSVKKIIKK